VPKAKVDAFAKELKDAGAKVTVIAYPNAKHSFTNPDADKVGMEALQVRRGRGPEVLGRDRETMFREEFNQASRLRPGPG
jgi:dienelactone hydrolase